MSRISKKRDNNSLLLFYVAYAMEVAIVLVDKSAYVNPIQGDLFRFTFLLCCLKVMLTKYTYKEWGLMIAFLALGTVSYFVTTREDIIRLVIFVAASKGVDIKRLLKATFYMTLIGVLLLIVLSLAGVLGWNYLEGDFDGDGPEGVMRRYCFGLGHPNALHCMVWSIVLLYLYNQFDRLKGKHFLIITLINTILFYLTDSKTGAGITYLSILLTLLMKYGKKLHDNKIVYLIGGLTVVSGVLFSVLNRLFGVELYMPDSKNFFAMLDKYLTGRLWLANVYAPISAWSAFSSPNNSVFFDMGYTRMFYWYGYIPTIIYIAVILVMIWYCYQKKDYMTFTIVIMFSVYTIVEAHAVSTYIARNYIVILLFGRWNEVFHVADGEERYFYQLIGRKNKQTES